METFLNIVAKDLYNKHLDPQKGLSDITVVFPNRRARLFFDDCLSACSATPVWSPQYKTIEELFQSQSDLRSADRIELITILYKVYKEEIVTEESLDSFWPWGELMLADFDDIDRNLADANQLFALLRDQKEMTTTEYLTDEQKDAIRQFFGEMEKAQSTQLREHYQKIWDGLGNVYKKFRDVLVEKGIGYNGMIQRRVIENPDPTRLTSKLYAFVGFNSLDAAEKSLFSAIKQQSKALFYWDYDPEYLKDDVNHEAGRFLRDNLELFPNVLDDKLFEGMHKANLTIVEASTDNAQARFITKWLDSIGTDGKPGNDTAIVLADESLLNPVLHSIPEDRVDKVNITMGYKLSETSIYSLVNALIDMQRLADKSRGRFSIQSISRVLSNPMTSALSDKAAVILENLRKTRRMYPDTSSLLENKELAVLFGRATDNASMLQYLLDVLKAFVPVIRERKDNTLFQPLNQESLYRIYTQINRLYSLTDSKSLDISTDTLCRLIRSILSSTTVPFHGEPADGMQIMGLIETRNLDFKNVLLLSAQEGTLPKSGQTASFIPYNIRVGFGLTSMQDKSAVSSYNFHHLLQRAENVVMVYNGNSEAKGIGKGQMSRYLIQLIVSGADIKRITLEPERSDTKPLEPFTVDKTPKVLKQMCERGKRGLAPSALNEYLECGLKYYLDQIAGISKPEESDTEIDVAMFGTVFHKSAELAYRELASANEGLITKEALGQLLKDQKRIDSFVKQAFDLEYFKNGDTDTKDYSGIQSVNFEVIKRYLTQILRMDYQLYAPFRYVGGEIKDFRYEMSVNDPLNPGQKFNVVLKGIIDRMDNKDGILRIVDYKTGRERATASSVDDMFNREGHNEYAFQIMFYAHVVSHQEKYANASLAPVLLYVRSTSNPSADDLYYMMDGNPVNYFREQLGNEFEEKLQDLINEIYDPDKPFSPTKDNNVCENCDFAPLCGKQNKKW